MIKTTVNTGRNNSLDVDIQTITGLTWCQTAHLSRASEGQACKPLKTYSAEQFDRASMLQGHTWTVLFSVIALFACAVVYAVQCQPVSAPPAAENADYAAVDHA